MAKKASAPNIIDVTAPGQSTPSSSARPIVVTNRPVLTTDPMMVVADGQTPAPDAAAPATAPLVSRQAKTIIPITEHAPAAEEIKADPEKPVPAEPEKKADAPDEKSEMEAAPVAAEEEPVPPEPDTPPEEKEEAEKEPKEKEAAAPPAAEENPTPAEPEAKEPTPAVEEKRAPVEPEKKENTPDEQSVAEAKEAAAAEARRQELEKMIASGKYVVPVNAVEKKRSQTVTVALTVLVVLLSIALVDLMLDANIINLLQKLPHTHFFSIN